MHDAFQGERSIARLLDAAVQCAAAGCNAPMAKVLELRHSDNFLIVKAQYGLDASVIGRDAGTAEAGNPPGQALITARPVVVADVMKERGDTVPDLLRECSVVTTINLPLIAAEGAYGILEVDYDTVHAVDASHVSFLASVAAILADGIESRQQREALIEDRDAKVTLLREQQHRIRNNFQMIAALLAQKAMNSQDPSVQKAYHDVERRVFAMASLYDHLLGLGEHGESVDPGVYLESMCASFDGFYDFAGHHITLARSIEQGAVMLGIDTCTAIGTVVNELVANAVEHAFNGAAGEIRISMHRTSRALIVEVRDNGSGYAAGATEGTGLATARRLIGNIGGELAVETQAGAGTRWLLSVTLPS
ncbi:MULTISPECIES: histidine kinase dimerization/phosphoacceptor domain -containing protein [unclassified Caballeronia]|uniref:sensor histidine kinase n=1 Tax=unclassified Caballeronia TaxID=2646786 RepID=UPI00285B128C|nr:MULTISPECIES: histidine kinase dimerization/phosphoacceptor domain -containing protein [unclassified Caballeronia]MDR5741466.1 histidine kinase dimerization/phosphoacceptor domain -containing protein [Caballeronia sp. LZ016]MDR5806779.1 histidine kinase dimerization/phosphoacceptor domain -containing protein [Caballeronia sp. LZ019]